MKRNSTTSLEERVKQAVVDPARKEMAARIAVDTTQLLARMHAGEDVEAELRQVNSQARSLLASEACEIEQLVIDWATNVAGIASRAVFGFWAPAGRG